ncbi:hypothetical protein PVK06_041757 [Gossypium arboreum]|uniref:ADP-ribosylation factor n=4 Tax=Gossypium TaxID=3633 RepID=A0ABR0N9P0_GOSAR|nr:hypothetical protein PVK06_041757 [Gossypium arboreum]
MGQAFRKLFDTFFGNSEMRVVMLGLDAAGKTTILYKLHIGEVLSTVPTIGFNVEKVQYKNVMFTVWDVGGQEKLRPLWRHYFNNTDGLIYVVDSLDRERIGKAKNEFQTIINDPFMLNSVILVFANKQDMKGAMTPMEVCEGLGLFDLKNRKWHIQGTCALRGDGLYEGLDWLASTLKAMRAAGYSSIAQKFDRRVLTLERSNPLHDHSAIKNVIIKKETPGGPNPLHNSNPPLALSGFNVIVKREAPRGGLNPLHNSNPLLAHGGFNIIVKRETPGDPNPLHNSNPLLAPSGLNIIMKRETLGGSNPIRNSNPLLAPSGFNVIVKRETPGGPNPIHNSNPPLTPSGLNIIVKRETPEGPNPLHNSNPLLALGI